MPNPDVLIVEDEFLIRAHIASIFEDAGCSTVEASSADEAVVILEKYRSLKAVVTDIRMPGQMDGMALARHVAKQCPDTQVVICSGNELPLKSALPKGARFLAKPLQMASLTELAADICHE